MTVIERTAIKISNMPPSLKYVKRHLISMIERQVSGIKFDIDKKEYKTNYIVKKRFGLSHNKLIKKTAKNY